MTKQAQTTERGSDLFATAIKTMLDQRAADDPLFAGVYKKENKSIRTDLGFPLTTPYKEVDKFYHKVVIPAWSLHRLIEMLNYQIIHNGKKYEPVIALDGMAYQDVCSNDAIVGWSGDLYTDVIDCIEWLIGEGYFNKEYLEE